jgi:hypothetical protein
MTEEDTKNFNELYADKAYQNWLSEAQRHSVDDLIEFISRTPDTPGTKRGSPKTPLNGGPRLRLTELCSELLPPSPQATPLD